MEEAKTKMAFVNEGVLNRSPKGPSGSANYGNKSKSRSG